MNRHLKQLKNSVEEYFSNYTWNLKKKLLLLITIFILILIDFIIKNAVINNLNGNEMVNFLPGFIQIELVYNTGAAFGIGAENPELMVVVQSIIILLILVGFLFAQTTMMNIGLALIVAGALSNFGDRFSNQIVEWGVVDYFSWQLFSPYSIFNIADMFVFGGTIVIILIPITSYWE
ncbi:signal peptidase II [Spiroplasma endosymbiont of Agriotes lineatus]|uniref:signal peptidase II n=1 Tax=Spiroplasma endosymbiont of Agriotes lineatus TaxID=3077930 RepID=UPI0030D1C502